MRFSEIRPLYEDTFGSDLGDFIEDDADHDSDNALIEVLRELQFSAGDKKIPKIAVGALLNLIKSKPGGEAFDLNALEKAKANNEVVKTMIKNIEDNEEGVKYVFLNPVEPIDNGGAEGGDEMGGAPTQTAPEKTVSQMANRALGSRG